MLKEAVIGGSKSIVENNAVSKRTEASKLVKCTKNVKIGGCPGISSSARVTRLGYPHLTALHVSVTRRDIHSTGRGSDRKIRIGVRHLCRPVTLRHNRHKSLGDAVVVMIGIYVHRNGVSAHKIVDSSKLHHISHSGANLCKTVIFGLLLGHSRVAGPYDKALGIVLSDPRVSNILIANVVGKIVSLGRARDLKHIRLVHKLKCVDASAKLVGESKELFDLSKIDSAAVLVVSCTVACGNKKTSVYFLYESEDIEDNGNTIRFTTYRNECVLPL
jgi:hypothetical protein